MDCRLIGPDIKTFFNLLKREAEHISLCNAPSLTMMQSWILVFLYENREKEIFQRDIEAEFQIRRSTVTGLLQLLEKNGYIRRVAVKQDARLKKLILTEAALQAQQKTVAHFSQLEQKMVEGINEEQLEIFCQVLTKMKANLEQNCLAPKQEALTQEEKAYE